MAPVWQRHHAGDAANGYSQIAYLNDAINDSGVRNYMLLCFDERRPGGPSVRIRIGWQRKRRYPLGAPLQRVARKRLRLLALIGREVYRSQFALALSASAPSAR
jgi:hypothetical protein